MIGELSEMSTDDPKAFRAFRKVPRVIERCRHYVCLRRHVNDVGRVTRAGECYGRTGKCAGCHGT
jgi:hypothetical protein